MRANSNTPRQGERKRGFDRNRLPPVADYYQPVFGELRFNASGWAQVRCVFHEDGHASLSIHREFGVFRCFACDARGDASGHWLSMAAIRCLGNDSVAL